MDHDSVVEDWQQNSEPHDEENYEFLRSMKYRDYGFDPDELAGELHEQAFQIVDCTRCAHCCKTMDIKFSDEDIGRIAEHCIQELREMEAPEELIEAVRRAAEASAGRINEARAHEVGRIEEALGGG